MLKTLSAAQKQLLTQAPDKWTRIPARVSVATLNALEKRGLVEYRYHFNPDTGFREWQWRAPPASLETRAAGRPPAAKPQGEYRLVEWIGTSPEALSKPDLTIRYGVMVRPAKTASWMHALGAGGPLIFNSKDEAIAKIAALKAT